MANFHNKTEELFTKNIFGTKFAHQLGPCPKLFSKTLQKDRLQRLLPRRSEEKMLKHSVSEDKK